MRIAPILLLAFALLGGCAVGPDYAPPEPELPGDWDQPWREARPSADDLHEWWTRFDDPLLHALIARAHEKNRDLREAVLRIEEARARYGVARADFFPDVDAAGGYSRGRPSESQSGVDLDDGDLFSLGFDSVWEIDVFGRIRRSIEAATADIEASEEDYHAVLVTLNAEVASTYVMLRTQQALLGTARSNVAYQQESLGITQSRFDTGIVPELDVFQARRNLADTESRIPRIETGITNSINRLAVLLGVFPGDVRAELDQPRALPRIPAEIATGAPADLLRRRPDIRASERRIAQQTALIGVATSELYPRFTLNGFFSFDAVDISDMFSEDSVAWSIGPAFRWNLFQGGEIRANIRANEARTEQALVRYENTILIAVEEVENAMVGYRNEQRRLEALNRGAEAARKTVELSSELYRRGLTNYQNVLDAFQSQLAFELDRAESAGAVLTELIRLYKALGGGWAVPSSLPEEEVDQS